MDDVAGGHVVAPRPAAKVVVALGLVGVGAVVHRAAAHPRLDAEARELGVNLALDRRVLCGGQRRRQEAAIRRLAEPEDVGVPIAARLLGRLARGAGVEAEDLDGLENVRATRHVPSSLAKALDALDADKDLRKAVGDLLCEAQLVLKRDEANRLADKSVDDIRDYYLPFI